jgi:hypothetical protein
MLNFERIYKQNRLMRALTGLTLEQFESLVDGFGRAYEQAIDEERRNRGCVRQKGACQKPRLSDTRMRLFFIRDVAE